MTADELREAVKQSRRRQGLPSRVEDPATLRRIAALLAPPKVPPAVKRRRAA